MINHSSVVFTGAPDKHVIDVTLEIMHQRNEPDCRNKCAHACVYWVLFSQIVGHTGSVEEQPAKYSLCVTVRAKRSQTTSLLWPCLVIEGENKEWNYMFIFENNFNLLSPHFGKKRHPQGHSKPRWAVGRLFQMFIHLMDVWKPEQDGWKEVCALGLS